MEDSLLQKHIIEKIKSGMHFGLFENESKCYFEDGERVRYNDLWGALNVIHDIKPGTASKSLRRLCPDTFEGAFSYRYSKHKWRQLQR